MLGKELLGFDFLSQAVDEDWHDLLKVELLDWRHPLEASPAWRTSWFLFIVPFHVYSAR